MAAAWIAQAVAAALRPLLRPDALAAAPRALSSPLLGPPPAAGFKTKGALRRRCRDCRLVKRRGRWFVYCSASPRHKQRQR